MRAFPRDEGAVHRLGRRGATGVARGLVKRGTREEVADIPGSVLFHPTEIVAQVLLQLLVTLIVLGLDPVAAALTGYLAAFCGMFQHWNVHTPRWLGYLIQRPEAHCEHHRLGVHAHNYGDLPIWDLALGTFRSPAHFEGDCGFESPADRRLGAMLAFEDVNRSIYGAGSRGAGSPARPAAPRGRSRAAHRSADS